MRDERIVSLASILNLDGYEQAPFSTSAVKQFLTKVAQLRQDLEEKAARERVRERVRESERERERERETGREEGREGGRERERERDVINNFIIKL